MKNKLFGAIFGTAVGDASGVPVEFNSRKTLEKQPVVDMTGYGTHCQPPGTWSDDSSLTFCLVEMLCRGYDLNKLAKYFVDWKTEAYWSAHGKVFDIGISTRRAIDNLARGINPVMAGGDTENDNGNGSLMRILPLAFYIKDNPIEYRWKLVEEISSLTHRHIRSIIACFIYIEYAIKLIDGKEKFEAFDETVSTVNHFLNNNAICSEKELKIFDFILQNPSESHKNLIRLSKNDIESSGYVVHSLKASLWSFLTSDSFEETVLKAVNLGEDTDTVGAVSGGLAGLYYGFDSIPRKWINRLARTKDIENLCARYLKVIE